MKTNKNMMINIYLFILISANFLFAQSEITTEVLTVRDGLSNSSIFAVFQDKYGYMWFATDDGINRYDGYQINIYKNIPNDTTSLPSNYINGLFEDSKGTLWISTNGGLAKFNRTKNNFRTFRYSDSNGELANLIWDIYEDSRKKLWVTTPNATFEFDRNSEKFKKYDIMKTDNSVTPYISSGGVIKQNSVGGLYNISGSFGLLKFDYDASLFVQVSLKNNFLKKLTYNIPYIMEFDKDNNIWLGGSDGLSKIDLSENKGYDFTTFKKRDAGDGRNRNLVSGLFIDKNQKMWVGTAYHGVYLFDFETEKFAQIIKPSSTKLYMGFYEDNSGLIWFGSSQGVQKYNFDRKPFESYSLYNNN